MGLFDLIFGEKNNFKCNDYVSDGLGGCRNFFPMDVDNFMYKNCDNCVCNLNFDDDYGDI